MQVAQDLQHLGIEQAGMVNNQNLSTLQNQLDTLQRFENNIPYMIEQTKKWINNGLVGTREPELARLHEVLNAATGYNQTRTGILPTKKRLQA
ncbi:hypothetical protein AAVH_28138 [Aphelenchoides avenae]|nr:hypothetical protein AAVH_28138 [Aphelenchus avenae]